MNAIVRRVAIRDHQLLMRLQLSPQTTAVRRRAWFAVTHAGGATTTLFASLAPLLASGSLRVAAERSLILLVVSHVIVQIIKRSVSRPRPMFDPLIRVPDRYSFPSGHAAAAASVALAYASVFPALAVPILTSAAVVGVSRVVLGVHFPADVIAGQLITTVSALFLRSWP
jgi:undecaprenyl-diphosphatase